ncbi:MAG: glycosyltransferase family 2 protein [Rivularia sp. (in: Bacteria)]|nr:glycosyltransferase family 2 protein [Rivularia sp. MS3]
MPKVSVIIPTYNAMRFLPETLKSIFRQTFTDFEILIVNDGSSDDIVEWVSQITDPRVKLISQVNQGVSAARNTGIRNAQGEYIAFIDADDLWEATKLEKQVKCMQANPNVGLVYTWTAFIDEFGKPTGISKVSHSQGDVWEEIVIQDMISTGTSAMVRAECFDKVGLFDVRLSIGEDRDMWTRIAAMYHFAVVKEFLTLYRRHSHNTTISNDKIIPQLSLVIEKTFANAPKHLLYLKDRSYCWINIYAAWSSIQEEKDYEQAVFYRRQAVQHYPRIRFTSMYLRQTIAITMLALLGTRNYGKVRGLRKTLFNRNSGIV